jgi:hypothetical protein
MLTETDRDYLNSRRHAVRSLKTVTWARPVVWVIGCVVAASRFPALINPAGVASDLDAGTIEWTLLRALARLAPMLFLIVLGVISGALYLFLRAAHREKRLLDLVDRAERGSVSPPLRS